MSLNNSFNMNSTIVLLALILFLHSDYLGVRVDLVYGQTSSLRDSPNEIAHVDLLTRSNQERHHTNRYESFGHRSLVLRRGEPLDLVVHLARPFNRTNDKIRFEFGFGNNPQLGDKSLNYVPLQANDNNNRTTTSMDEDENSDEWAARVTGTTANGRQLGVRIRLPVDMPIGLWRLKISIKSAGSPASQILTYAVRDQLYVLFNAWNKFDDVYLAREDARQEYVLNEVGKIYVGTYTQPVGRKWTYGQFDGSVLPAVMWQLDKTSLNTSERADVVKVARAVSAMVNSHDDGGFLVGDWSGNYGNGLAPWSWAGSAPVFKRYIQSGYKPVKFAQCWVFGGVTTTSLRTLGIPARSISNFVSAHDTDFSLTVDKFSDRGSEISGVNSDSTWNFHVWSDAWMSRRDLPPGFGGWQAIDATPQEQSMGKYQLGPASLEAIKQGKVSFAYDVGFVYSEVNAELVYWQTDSRSRLQWRRAKVQTGHHGRKILTKIIGVLDERSRSGTNDAEDIVYQYKFKEGSPEARRAYSEAAQAAGLVPLFSGSR